MKIFKYPFHITPQQSVSLPRFSKILKVDTQREVPCIWAMVDPTEKMEEHDLFIFGTGHDLPEDIEANYNYIGTIQTTEEIYVWHVFIREI